MNSNRKKQKIKKKVLGLKIEKRQGQFFKILAKKLFLNFLVFTN